MNVLELCGVSKVYGDGPAEVHALRDVSLSVDDIPATCALVEQHGGEVLTDTDIGGGIFVRDPDGQLIELLPMAYAERVATEG